MLFDIHNPELKVELTVEEAQYGAVTLRIDDSGGHSKIRVLTRGDVLRYTGIIAQRPASPAELFQAFRAGVMLAGGDHLLIRDVNEGFKQLYEEWFQRLPWAEVISRG